MFQKQLIHCSSNVYYPDKNLPQYVECLCTREKGWDETLTNSWGMHLTNKVLLEIKKPSEITHEKIHNFDHEFGFP